MRRPRGSSSRSPRSPAVTGATLNLYGDLLLPLSESTACEPYLADTSDGPATAAVQAPRDVLWERLRGTPFGVERLQPAVFVHFGSTAEYWQMAAGDPDLADLCGLVRRAAAWTGIGEAADRAPCAGECHVKGPIRTHGVPVLVMDSRLRAAATFDGAAIIAGVQPGAAFARGAGHRPAPDARRRRSVRGPRVSPWAMIPSSRRDAPGTTFMNQAWEQWLAEAGVTPEQVWPHVTPHQRTSWNARLYPVAADREESLRLALPLQDPASAPTGWLSEWRPHRGSRWQRGNPGRRPTAVG